MMMMSLKEKNLYQKKDLLITTILMIMMTEKSILNPHLRELARKSYLIVDQKKKELIILKISIIGNLIQLLMLSIGRINYQVTKMIQVMNRIQVKIVVIVTQKIKKHLTHH